MKNRYGLTPAQLAMLREKMFDELFAARDAASPEAQAEFDRVLRIANETRREAAHYLTQLAEIVGLRKPAGPYTKQ